MAELRLYAIGIDEALDLQGADPADRPRLRDVAIRSSAPAPPPRLPGLLGRVGPLFARSPEAPVIRPDDPTPDDIDNFLSGDHIVHDRVPAAWRILEALVSALCWGSHRLAVDPPAVDEIDFALARGGVPTNLGLRHLLATGTEVRLPQVAGLQVGWYGHPRARTMAAAYRSGLDQVPAHHRDAVTALITWLAGYPHWAEVAPGLGRPQPDLLGFWVH